MDSSFAIAGKDFVIVAADATVQWHIFRIKDTEDKIFQLEGNKLMSVDGEAADRLQFADYIAKNVNLYKYRNGYNLTTKECANYVRSELAYAIRHGPYQVNVLLAGIDEDGPGLYRIDYLGTLHKIHVAAHGYTGKMISGLLDNLYKEEITLEEAKKAVYHCINELKTRFIASQPNFVIKVVTKNGVELIADK